MLGEANEMIEKIGSGSEYKAYRNAVRMKKRFFF